MIIKDIIIKFNPENELVINFDRFDKNNKAIPDLLVKASTELLKLTEFVETIYVNEMNTKSYTLGNDWANEIIDAAKCISEYGESVSIVFNNTITLEFNTYSNVIRIYLNKQDTTNIIFNIIEDNQEVYNIKLQDIINILNMTQDTSDIKVAEQRLDTDNNVLISIETYKYKYWKDISVRITSK